MAIMNKIQSVIISMNTTNKTMDIVKTPRQKLKNGE